MARSEQKMPLPKLDDLFTTQDERDNLDLEKVRDIPLTEIQDFPEHPFKVIVNEELNVMAQSISEQGVLSPVLVRPLPNGGYQMIAGHRRKKASELANKDTIPCIVRELTDDQATIIMVDSNLQREELLPSEKAFAYKMKMEAEKQQGKRTDLTTSCQVGTKLRSDLKIAEQTNDSARQIQRYIRLTELIKPLLDMVDNKDIAFNPAVEISYLTKKEQEILVDSIECNIATPSLSQAQEMKRLSQSGNLDEDKIDELLSQEKPNQVVKLKLDMGSLKKKIPRNIPETQYVDFIDRALDFYSRHLEKQKSMGAR